MAGNFFHPLVMLLVVSQLIFLHAASSPGTGDHLFSSYSQDALSSDQNNDDQMKIRKQGAGRENLEYNDYPGTGANDRHSPPAGPGENN